VYVWDGHAGEEGEGGAAGVFKKKLGIRDFVWVWGAGGGGEASPKCMSNTQPPLQQTPHFHT